MNIGENNESPGPEPKKGEMMTKVLMRRMEFGLVGAVCLSALGCGLSNGDEITSKESALSPYESTGVPPGFVSGMAYAYYKAQHGDAVIEWNGTTQGDDGTITQSTVT